MLLCARMQGLSDMGYELVSTGGSAKAIEAAGIPVKEVAELTGFPEMLDGALRCWQHVHMCSLGCRRG
jgi:phosphoribosylaminoimidazolecarboxamide formyltransferase/IMP cyclohydrolase